MVQAQKSEEQQRTQAKAEMAAARKENKVRVDSEAKAVDERKNAEKELEDKKSFA